MKKEDRLINNLKGKNILLFVPSFFGYDEKIAKKMIDMGACVDYYDERSIGKNWQKALLKINPNIFAYKTKKYYKRIILENKNKAYDYILFIKAEMVTEDILHQLKKQFPESKLILYLFDSLQNIKNINKKLKYFDRILSFDRVDCINNSNFIFRPLFYCDEYRNENIDNNNFKYDICFIGTVHSDRFKILNKLRYISKQLNINVFFYLFIQSKMVYYFFKIFLVEFKNTKSTDFKYEKISSYDIANILQDSKIIIDIEHKKQTGLTIRSIETVGCNKKLITTNKDIVNYDFYNSSNIYIMDRNDVRLDINFIEEPYKNVSLEIYERYSLENWIKDVLGADADENFSYRS